MVTHIKPEGKGRVVDMTPEMARAANVAEGSLVVLSFKEGDVTAEILPPGRAAEGRGPAGDGRIR